MDKHKEIELEHTGKEDTAVNMLVDTQVYTGIHRYTGSTGPPKLPHPPGVSFDLSLDWHYELVGPATQADKQTIHIQTTLDKWLMGWEMV